MSDEFQGFDWDAGSVFGVRQFRVDQLGRLRSPTQNDFVWKPGENVAKCCSRFGAGSRAYGANRWPSCGCGFYAYWDGNANRYKGPTYLTGAIEAYGKTVIGTRGLRSEKAKIVGLVVPGAFSPRGLGERFLAAFKFWHLLLASIALAVVLWVAFGEIASHSSKNAPWSVYALGIITLLMAIASSGWVLLVTAGGFDEGWTECPFYDGPGYSPINVDLLKRNYPDIQFFSSAREMNKAFQIEKPPIATALTPEHPDFWAVDAPLV